MRLVTLEDSSVIPHGVDISACALNAQSLLERVDGVLIAESGAAGPPEGASECGHVAEYGKGTIGTAAKSEREEGVEMG